MLREFTRSALERAGFEGFVTVADLRASTPRTWSVPADAGGVYLAIRTADGPPRFLTRSPAGQWGGDPTLPLTELRRRWVDRSPIVYVGKADLTSAGNTLRKRVRSYLRFGAGGSARHRGGYPTWQLADSSALLIAWLVVDGPRTPLEVEREVRSDHIVRYGSIPFANSVA